jgi:hypothetical protein
LENCTKDAFYAPLPTFRIQIVILLSIDLLSSRHLTFYLEAIFLGFRKLKTFVENDSAILHFYNKRFAICTSIWNSNKHLEKTLKKYEQSFLWLILDQTFKLIHIVTQYLLSNWYVPANVHSRAAWSLLFIMWHLLCGLRCSFIVSEIAHLCSGTNFQRSVSVNEHKYHSISCIISKIWSL